MIHHRAGLMDGVSLEMDKWRRVLEDMGHEVVYVAGNDRADIVVEGMDVDFETLKRLYSGELDESWIENEKERFKEKLAFLKNFDLWIVNNIWSLGFSLPLGLALEELKGDFGTRAIGHHHDFWWERENLRTPRSKVVLKILREHFPPNGIEHVVINSIAKEKLKKRRNFESIVIPNVFDFSKPLFKDEDRYRLRKELDIDDGTIVFLQATRITKRKAIELSIEFVSEFQKMVKNRIGERLYNGAIFNGKVFLVFSGMVEHGDRDYWRTLLKVAEDLGVKTINVHGRWEFFRTYALADAVTYPTILEGFGNQLLEAICAKKPILIFEYEVFKKDIKPLGFKFVSLGDKYRVENGLIRVNMERISKAAEEMMEILFDGDKYEELTKRNFEIAKRHFDLEVLRDILEDLIGTG